MGGPLGTAKRKEYWVAGIMAMTGTLTLAGYELMRSASTVLFKSAYGAQHLPLVMAAMPFVVFAAVWAYGHTLTALGPRRTLLATTLGSSLLICLCYLMLLTGSQAITPVLYLLKEIYIVLLIEQYWSYINSMVSTRTSRRVNGPITGIAGLGSVAGGYAVSATVEHFGTHTMILFGALALIPAAMLGNLAYRLFGEPENPPAPSTQVSHMGWRWLVKDRTLLYLLLIVLATQMVAAALDLKFQGILSLEYAGRTDEETAFQGWFFGTLNSVSLALQFLVAPVLLSLVPLRLVHILMPAIHLTAIAFAIAQPSVFSVGLAFLLFKAFDYSVFRAAKEVLYVPLSFDERYRAKEVIDVFGYRSGKGGTSIVITGLQRLGVTMSDFYLGMAFFAVTAWLALIFPLTRRAKAVQEES